MRRKRTVIESGRNPNPTKPVGVQDEGLVSSERVVAFGAGLRLVICTLRGDKIGHVEASPLLGASVQPNELLSFAPRLAVRPGRGASVENAAVGWPGESPTVTIEIFRVA